MIVIADHRESPRVPREQFQKGVLAAIRVLVFVNKHVADAGLPARTPLRASAQCEHGQKNQVVEVDRVARLQVRDVIAIDCGLATLEAGTRVRCYVFRRAQIVLPVGDRTTRCAGHLA